MKKSFLNREEPMLTSMVLADTPERTKYLIKKSDEQGADAFGVQFDHIKNEYCSEKMYREIAEFAGEKPIYATNYKRADNVDKPYEVLEKELVLIAECGATLCDVMSDYYDAQPDEFTTDIKAVDRQKKLIDTLHEKGAEVIMSAHVLKFTPAEKILEIAMAQQERGADISKIVTGADTMEQQLENLKILNLLKENLKIPFLFLSGGESFLLRRVGDTLGNCMTLCVCEHDKYSVKTQPLIEDMIKIRKLLDKREI